jgi:hypothetical protein
MDHFLQTNEEVEGKDEDEDAPSTQQIPEHYRRRLDEINQERRDIQEQNRQTVDQMMIET